MQEKERELSLARSLSPSAPPIFRKKRTSTPSTKNTSATVAEEAKPWCGSSSGVGAWEEGKAQEGGSMVGGREKSQKQKTNALFRS